MISTVAWSFLLMSAVIGLKLAWLMIVAVAVTLNCANLVGYFKCRSTTGDQLQAGLKAAMATAAVSAASNSGSATGNMAGTASTAVGMLGGFFRSAAAGAANAAAAAARSGSSPATNSGNERGSANFRYPTAGSSADTPI